MNFFREYKIYDGEEAVANEDASWQKRSLKETTQNTRNVDEEVMKKNNLTEVTVVMDKPAVDDAVGQLYQSIEVLDAKDRVDAEIIARLVNIRPIGPKIGQPVKNIGAQDIH